MNMKPFWFGAGPARNARVLFRLGAIGAVMLSVAGAFAYVGGWLSPVRLTQDRMMAAFQDANGIHAGFRRNHAKGICVTGWFESSGQAAALSKAAVFRPGRVPVVGRFALAGGLPFQPDAPATVRSMALRFLLPGGEEWRTGMNNIPVFPVNSARGFYEQLLASSPDPVSGKPDPVRMKAFLAAHPETVRALRLIKKRQVTSGFANSTFNSLNAFRFVDAAGASVPVRWSTVPVQPFAADSAGPSAAGDKNYLFDDLINQITQHPLRWRLIVTIGQADDPTNDATLPWPADLQQVDAGTVTIDHASSEDGGRCTAVNYDPLVLPSGIEPSDDPLLSARSAAYARSFTLRAEEEHEKPPSAVTTQEVQAGGES
ncbi:MAG TPA: catalase family peroxidase [Steroidobacteraceae bacterium]|jgi:catalase|nr:catalase family peroxidase [Steroidobacteraceae bacterium]